MSDNKRELITFLRRSSELIEHLIEDAAGKWQLSVPEMRILLFLDQNPELDTARDVAIHCGMSKASVSGNVLKLATRGLLTVDVDLKDRRFQHLTLTEQTQPILSHSRGVLKKADELLMERLSTQEQELFLGLLKKLNGDGHL